MNNFIYIKQPDYSTKIYRIFSTNRLIELFEKKENALVKPELWDDPFENFILKIPEKGSKSKPNKRGYGQCWTLNFESDAMWRIYSPDKKGLFRILCQLTIVINHIRALILYPVYPQKI